MNQIVFDILELIENFELENNPFYNKLCNKYSLFVPEDKIPGFNRICRLTIPNNTIMFTISNETNLLGVYLDMEKDTINSPPKSTCINMLKYRITHFYGYNSHKHATIFISAVMNKFLSYEGTTKMVDLRKELEEFINKYKK